jgi:hypothetical protein
MSNALVAQPGSAIFVIRLIGEKALDGIRTRDLYLIGSRLAFRALPYQGNALPG